MKGKDEVDLKRQFKRAFVAILNCLGSNQIAKLNFGACVKVKRLIVSGDGAAIEYNDFDPIDSLIDKDAEAISNITGMHKESFIQAMSPLTEYFDNVTSEIFRGFIEGMKSDSENFPLEYNRYENSIGCYLQAKNLSELIRGFNMMLAKLGLPKDYEIALPPKQRPGPG